MKALIKAAKLAGVLIGMSCVLLAQPQSAGKQPEGKHVPQAKTKAEYNDYNTAYAVSGGSPSEKAADDFAAKYPSSELTIFLYSKAMHEYQTENNKSKIETMGNKVLQFDPDNPVALVLTATVMADSLATSDADQDKQVAAIRKNGSHALQTINSDFSPGGNVSPEQLAAYKKTLESMAHAALGIAALKSGDDAGAEKELKTAADVNSSQPDPYVWYHLALAQDHQKKYPEALASVNQAVKYSGSDPDLATLAKGEQTRLQTLNQATAGTPQ
jgi:tetratricopeptide (TPR) repeat protein